MPGADRLLARSPTVVVTGIGAVSPLGWSIESFWDGLRAGRTAVGPFDRFDHARHRTHIAAQVDLDAEPRPVRGRPRRVTHADRFAVAAARSAVEQAAVDLRGRPGRAGVYFGSCTGGMFESEAVLESLLSAAPHRAARPAMSLLASQQNNGPGDAVARDLGVGGPVETVSAACASGAIAIGAALNAVRRGEVDLAVAGGSDSLCRLTYAGFNALRSVDERPCRPFRGDRAGLSLGEGSAALVLETLEHARARGARPLAIVAGEAATCDAHHMTSPQPEGRGAADAIRGALSDARLDPAAIDFVNAHGTGTPLNDAAECAALVAVFAGRATDLPVTSTKSLVGHPLGSAGALEAVATILCLRNGEVHPMPGEGDADPALPLRLVQGRPLSLARARHALSTSLGFGGANAALVFTRFEEAGRAD